MDRLRHGQPHGRCRRGSRSLVSRQGATQFSDVACHGRVPTLETALLKFGKEGLGTPLAVIPALIEEGFVTDEFERRAVLLGGWGWQMQVFVRGVHIDLEVLGNTPQRQTLLSQSLHDLIVGLLLPQVSRDRFNW